MADRSARVGSDFGMPFGTARRPPPPPPVARLRHDLPLLNRCPPAPVRRERGVVQSNLIYTVKPTYPRLAAMTARAGHGDSWKR